MTKSKLIKTLCTRKPDLNPNEVASIVDLIFEIMSEALSRRQRIEIRGLGSFSLRQRKARNNARDPRNGNPISIEDRWVVYFRQGKGFFDKINKK